MLLKRNLRHVEINISSSANCSVSKNKSDYSFLTRATAFHFSHATQKLGNSCLVAKRRALSSWNVVRRQVLQSDETKTSEGRRFLILEYGYITRKLYCLARAFDAWRGVWISCGGCAEKISANVPKRALTKRRRRENERYHSEATDWMLAAWNWFSRQAWLPPWRSDLVHFHASGAALSEILSKPRWSLCSYLVQLSQLNELAICDWLLVHWLVHSRFFLHVPE